MSNDSDRTIFIAKLILILVPVCIALAVLGGIAKGIAHIADQSIAASGNRP